MSINGKYQAAEKFDIGFWRSVGVAIDSILELKLTNLDLRFNNMLGNLTIDELKELASFYNVDKSDDKKDLLSLFRNVSEKIKREILILRDFLSRKKRTVIRYYNSIFGDTELSYEKSQICQLAHLLSDNIIHFAQIYTLYHWDSKGTGTLYSLNKNVTYEKTIKIPTEYAVDFVNDLYKHSKEESNYKIFSYGTEAKDKVVVMLYRQINDSSRPDFDEPFRNKEVAPIMFCINVSESILEVRSKYQKEISGIKQYCEKTFGTALTEVKPGSFSEYQPDEVKNAILMGVSPNGEEVNDFLINMIVFRGSPLINSPSLTFKLENQDILPSIKDAFNRDCIDLESIKDLESLSFKTSKVSRTVRSTLLENGDVMFSIDDSGLDPSIKLEIERKFLDKFGIPLNKRISNAKFSVGKADIIDYIMGLSFNKGLDTVEYEIFEQLIKENILEEKKLITLECYSNECDYNEDFNEDFNEEILKAGCPKCSNDKIQKRENDIFNVSFDSAFKYIKESLSSFCDDSDWELNNDSEKTIYETTYRFINLENKLNGEAFQILVTRGSIQKKVLDRINRFLTPTVVVFLGLQEKYIGKYSYDCIYPVNFGRIYVTDEKEELFEKIYLAFQHRSKSFLSSIANKSFEILSVLPSPTEIGKDYTPSDFEDDCFNLIKDIFPNAEKWGKKFTGKEVPEGIFALTFREQKGSIDNNKQYVFSYDCKLNKTKIGYDLGKSEQRKAFDYAEMLNEVKYISRFSSNKQISSHIFISNNFNENNYDTMAEYFYRKLPEGYDTRPIFLPLEVLLYLHSEYRKNHQKIHNSRNEFLSGLYQVFTTDKYVITREDINEVLECALDEDLADYKELDTKKVTKDVLKRIKKRG